MSKAFLETFPSLSLDKELEQLLNKTEVTKISANHDHSKIRIYLHAERLIFKKNIWKLEKLIAEQIFRDKYKDVKIIETFTLSGQYTLEALFDEYFDCFLHRKKLP